ncbi:hypothetical protein CROQUDRAFT_665404 [Cronartium quercuum f. sp. fusiforme G11]|uniref:Small ribosomal subunit protein uS7 domain-containing protein n=1 Tax=Cronartium quercuum f. sp. fusiforme G11 TaxID=708437 RepID=A0A9P6T6C7_9BASI|nr:hypothetical protein CROQUDRAFT_665404 [Cronartium quercuum f. sp. fusiforme G11]
MSSNSILKPALTPLSKLRWASRSERSQFLPTQLINSRQFRTTSHASLQCSPSRLDRHPRARLLPVYQPPPPFPATDDVASLTAFRDPPVSVPPLEHPLLNYLTGLLMRKGKRTIAQKHCVTLLSHLRLITNQDPLPLLTKAVELASPMVLTRTEQKRIKVTTVPVALQERQRLRKGILWMVKQSERRPGKKFGERLAMEVLAVLNGTSETLKLKAEQHRLAFVNRANLRTRVTRA